MNLRKKECPLQSIKSAAMAREPGTTGWTVGLFFLLFLAVYLCAFLQLELYRTASLYLEDALAASNLASAVVDLEEYGISHKILVEDPRASYGLYRWAVRENLNLDEAWRGRDGGVISSQVRVVEYTVYTVTGENVEIYHFDGNGVLSQRSGVLGNVEAPNGRIIENTSVYSEIAFMLRGVLGIEVEAHKGNLADITR